MVIPSERRPNQGLDVRGRTARHYVRIASMSAEPGEQIGLNPLYEKIRRVVEPKLAQVGSVYRRSRTPRR